MLIPKRLMPHKILASRYKGEGSTGPVYHPEQEIKRAYCEDKRQMVKDRNGAEIVSNSFVILDPEPIMHPDDSVTIWPGSGRQRVAQVISTAFYDHPEAPSHQIIYLA